jgi:hypothetical protein
MKKLTVFKDRYIVEERTSNGYSREIRPRTWTPVFADYDEVLDDTITNFEENAISKLPKEQSDKRKNRIDRLTEAFTEREKANREGDKYVSPRQKKLVEKLTEAVEALPDPVKKVIKNKKEV